MNRTKKLTINFYKFLSILMYINKFLHSLNQYLHRKVHSTRQIIQIMNNLTFFGHLG